MGRVSLEFEELTGVAVDSLHEGTHALRVHVGVEAVAQVGDVAARAKRFQHLPHNLRDALLGHRGDCFIQTCGTTSSSSSSTLTQVLSSVQANQKRLTRGGFDD